jgi:hypothetical protein
MMLNSKAEKIGFGVFVAIVIAFIFMAFMEEANAEGPVVDPNLTPSKTLTCDYPVTRTDGTPLALDEIATVQFYVSQDETGTKTWTPAGSNDTECKQVYDLTAIPDGQYYYSASAVDTGGRESVVAPGYSPLVLQRIAPPETVTGLRWE